ncbi:MAG: SUMF1/EgtB/PvdO family nonheme iron enzyme [Planctomycetota bacterium]|nr:SUMF1/EgtB/PvdO family nonheme iron enzyme [Planctomycetota bacterium]
MKCLLRKPFFCWLAASACLFAASAGAGLINYQKVTVGNAGNANDTTGYGAVAYEYQIGKYDVTIGQYTAFLNAADPDGTNPNGLYNSSMGTNLTIAGISYAGEAAAGAKYSVIDNGGDSSNRPITYVSWFDAARFANWMTNGQGSGSTETGAYDLATAEPGVAPAKTPGAAFSIPSENEWYKAAYYSPNYGGDGVPGYYAYATQSDTAPGNIIGSDPNQANYYAGLGWSVTQTYGYDPDQNYLTDVGAFSGSGSFYGTFDQSGNVYQWNDLDGTPGSSRGYRGGPWSGYDFYLSPSLSLAGGSSSESGNIGFRLASPVSSSAVPEIDPAGVGSVLALVAGALGLLERRRLKAA